MVFASLSFLYIFLPLNLGLYYITRNATYRNVLLIFFSLVFYAWGEPVWIALLFGSAIIDWLNALFIDKYRGTKWAVIGVVISVLFNIGLLVLFKYSGFVYQNINSVFGTHLAIPEFALPVGISFKVFQTVSYVIDVYRGEIRTQKSFMKYLMFVSLYHHLVAGPIVRYAHIAHEIDNRKFNLGDISAGVTRFCIGLFKKVCIANVAGEFVVRYMENPDATLSVGGAWFGAVMFTVQIYFDFSGYSDMAIGLGKMFGFHYRENFRYPYIAASATDFWRRWHISLSTFFRDYIYIPLGGNRGGSIGTWIISGMAFAIATTISVHALIVKNNTLPLIIEAVAIGVLLLPALLTKKMKIASVLNLFIIWFLTGMWHGHYWNFILWGLYFGVLIYLERTIYGKFLEKFKVIGHVYMIIAATIGWVLFKFVDFARLKAYLGIMFANGFGWHLASVALLFCVLYMLFSYWKPIGFLLKKYPPAVAYFFHTFTVLLALRVTVYVYILVLRPFLEKQLGAGTIPNWDFAVNIDIRENLFWLLFALVLCMPVYALVNRATKRLIVVRKWNFLMLFVTLFNVVLLFCATTMLVGKSYNPFIYYRF